MRGKTTIVRQRKKALKKVQRHQYDPGMTLSLQNHCAYACMYFGLTGCKATLQDACWMRRKIAKECRAAVKAESFASILDMSTGDYEEEYIRNEGWGGLPEIAAYAAATSKQVCIASTSGQSLYNMHPHADGQEIWCYDGRRYTVTNRADTTLRWQVETGTGYDA